MLDDVRYVSVEHAYQAAKSLDPEVRKLFIQDIKAGDAKKLGQQIELRPDWEQVKYNIMLDLVRQKFNTDEDLKAQLLATGEAYLEETNHWGDVVWGVCKGVGKNWLGKILMTVRRELQ